jgi:hypothetical protein
LKGRKVGVMRIGYLVAIKTAIIFSVSIANGQTWDAASDWVAQTNPNGAWSYGFQPALTDPLTLYNVLDVQEGGRWQLNHASSISTAEPYIGQVVSGGYLSSIPEGTVVGHPGPGSDNGVPGGTKGQYTTLRWTAPGAGLYKFDVLFEGLAGPVLAPCCPHTTTDVHVLVNGTEQFSGLIEGYVGGHPEDPNPAGNLRTQSWQQTLNLAAGGTVDFAVGDGENASYYADLTGITAIVNLVPEPTTSLLVLVLGAALATCRVRVR